MAPPLRVLWTRPPVHSYIMITPVSATRDTCRLHDRSALYCRVAAKRPMLLIASNICYLEYNVFMTYGCRRHLAITPITTREWMA